MLTREEKVDTINRHCLRYKTCAHDKERGRCPLFSKNEIFLSCYDDSVIDRNYEIISAISEKEKEEDMGMKSQYRENILKIMDRQQKKGVKKYGQLLENNDSLSAAERIEYLQEELVDALQYCEHIKASSRLYTPTDYQAAAMRTAGEYKSKLDMLRNAVYGLNGEAGEIIDLLKKHEFQGHELSYDMLAEELGDVLWYAALMCEAIGVSLERVMCRNIEKLQRRYPEGFSAERSVNREEDSIDS